MNVTYYEWRHFWPLCYLLGFIFNVITRAGRQCPLVLKFL